MYEHTNNVEFQYGHSTLNLLPRDASIGLNQQGTTGTDFMSVTPGDYATVSMAISDNNIGADKYPGNGVAYQFKHMTWVPDDNLEQVMIDEGWDTTLDDYVLTHNIKYETSFYPRDKGIYLAIGIEDMKALENLGIGGNNLISLNLDNRHLHLLMCSDNKIMSTIDVTKLPMLDALNAENCNFKEIDLSHNPLLKILKVRYEELSSLNVENNPLLEIISAPYNNLTSIIIGDYTNLKELNVDHNKFTELDVSKMTNLGVLNCSNNDISVLEPNSASLQSIYCNSTLIESIDLTQMGFGVGNLHVDLRNNPYLTYVDMRNEANYGVSSFTSNNCPELTCVYVDDKTSSYIDDWVKDPWTHFVDNETECDEYRFTNVPDANFEHYLETHNSNGQIVSVGASNSMGNGTDNDHLVYTSRIENVTELNVHEQNISDLTGIADFAALSYLNCNTNNLSELNIKQNTQLQTLYCNENSLTTLDLSESGYLNILSCAFNNINNLVLNANRIRLFNVNHNNLTSLDLTQLTSLGYIDCSYNELGSLDIRNGNNTIITTLFANENENLSCIYVDDPAYCQTNWTSKLDPDAHFVANDTECTNLTLNTYVPDDNFEQALIDLGLDSAPLDDYVPTSAIDTLQTLLVYSKNISDLTGIEDFTSLKTLNCSRNQLTTVDLRYNTKLEYLFISDNNISELNLMYNTSIKRLLCDDNQLTYIYLNSPALWELSYSNNHLTDIDLTRSVAIKNLGCSNNQLTSLNIKDLPVLKNLYADHNELSEIDFKQNPALVFVNLTDNNFTSLDISSLSNLSTLIIKDNQLTSLDISNNNNLGELFFSRNRVSNLIIGDVTSLEILWCEDNLLTSLDVSQQTMMMELGCSNNSIESLDIRNGNNVNMYEFEAKDNNLGCIYVDDVAWAEANWSDRINGDAHFVADENECATYNKTYVPDDNLEQALIDMGYDTGEPDDYVPTENIRTITDLDISNKQIEDLTGLEDFTALENLNCSMNKLRSLYIPGDRNELKYLNISENDFMGGVLDLNNFVSLEEVFASSANIARLDFDKLSNLNTMVCNDNSISNIELGGSLKLKNLNVADNQLTSVAVINLSDLNLLNIDNNNIENVDISNQNRLLIFYAKNNALNNSFDFSKNPYLKIININNNNVGGLSFGNSNSVEFLSCSHNSLEELDLTQIDSVNYISCSFNRLTNLDVTYNSAVENLFCNNNLLTNLDVRNGNNTKIINFVALNNPDLGCIYVDDPAWSNDNWSIGINGNEHFVADETECTTTSVGNDLSNNLTVYPVPVTNVVHINVGSQKHIDVYLYNNLGQRIDYVFSDTGMAEFNMSDMPMASYIIKIIIDDKKIIDRIVIKK